MKHTKITLTCILITTIAAVSLQGCRRVTLVGDSLFGCARDTIVEAIDNNNEKSWVYTEHIWGGSTAYNNPINHEIYSLGMEQAFGFPDVVVFSFATNEMSGVSQDMFSIQSAKKAMETLINQAVSAGAECIVMLESSHRFRGDPDINSRFEMNMDDWFDHWHRKVGENEFLGMDYTFLIADISTQLEAELDTYIVDYIHFNEVGAGLAAAAITEQINRCPQGRWIFGANEPDPQATFAPNPYREYVVDK